MISRKIKILIYKFSRFIERYPSIALGLYNNISLFSFFLPHEKDYYGMLKICKNKKNLAIIDVGANLGISTLGFRKLGFKNPIYLFEPNFFLYENYLKKLKKKINNLYIKNFALGEKNSTNKFYLAFYKNKCLHFCSSFSKKYIKNTINTTFPNYKNKIYIKSKLVKSLRFDSLNIKHKPHFVKLDTEGFDCNILKGFKKTIKKHQPIFLIEYNADYHNKILKILKEYIPVIYDYESDKFLIVNKMIRKNKISRNNKKNLLSNRNIYFLPKKLNLKI